MRNNERIITIMEGIIELKTVRDKGIKNPVYETD